MVRAKIFEKFHPVSILLLGDYMVDRYTIGKVKRISPEAPVPVLLAEKEEMLPGGAGNVVLNLLSL
ncbi:MAG: HldE protein, partial [Chlamydiota bacterium]